MENTDLNAHEKFKRDFQVKAIPEGYEGATPYLYVNDAARALEFYKRAFNAEILMSMKDEKGRISHSDMKIGKANIMVSDEYPESKALGPRNLGGSSAGFLLYFEDAKKAFDQAISAGAKSLEEVTDHFWGDRMGKLEDPFGHFWYIATHFEDVSNEEMKKRAQEWQSQH